MGPSRTSFEAKSEAIKNLEAQLEVQKTKTGLLQQRLITALDALDHLQTQYLIELDTEAEKRRHAETKLRRYIHTVQAAEVERDDLRDAVMKLVMKVESGNDVFNCWPRSDMHISSILGPTALTSNHSLDQAISMDGSHEQLLLYAGAIIDALRHERDVAKSAHAQSREMFEGRIHTLEAQLARRDAELEAQAGYFPLTTSGAVWKEMHKNKQISRPPVSVAQEEVVTMVQRIEVRNKTLEEEIKGLFQQLQHARIAKSASPLPLLPAQPPPDHAPTRFQDAASPVRAPSAELDPPLELPYPFGTLKPDTAVKLLHDNHSDLHHQNVSYLNQQIAELSAVIDAFKIERDALWEVIASQRDGLPSSTRWQYSPELEPQTSQKPQTTLEDECISLRRTVLQLREELRKAKENARERERELHEQIEQLRKSQRLTDTAPDADDLTIIQQDHLLNTYDGEMSMDLATPLFPISLLPPLPPPRLAESRSQSRSPVHSLQTKYVPIFSDEEGRQSPRMIPPRILASPSPSLSQSSSRSSPSLSPTPNLPAHPTPPAFIQNPPSASMPPLPPRAGPISTVSVPHANIERVERELAAEQLRLQEGEQQLEELQNVLQELHEQHQHQMSNVR